MTKFFFIFFTALFFVFSAFGRDYKIEELLEIAQQNSANIRSAQYLAQSQKHFANQQKYWENPTIEFSNIGDEDTYTISQTIPFFNKTKNKYNIEEAQFRALDARKNNLELFVQAEVFRLIYQYQAIKKKIALAQKRLDRLVLIEKYLANIALNSPTKKAQSQITKSRIKLVERDLAKFRNDFYQTWNAVNIYLNLESPPTNIVLQWIDNSNYLGRQFFIEAALENNWELKEQKILIGKAKSELSYAKIEQMPDVNVSAIRETVSASASGGRVDSNGIGVSVSIPLLNRNKEKIAAARSRIKASEQSFEFERNQMIQLLNNNISDYETSLKLAEEFQIKNIDKALTRLFQAHSDFKKGVLDFTTYIELDSQEYQMIEVIIDTQVELAASYSSLMTKVGKFIPNQKMEMKND